VDSADLRVTLTSGGLDYLDEVVITILDEAGRDHWAHGLPDGVTRDQAEAFVWGPWKFNTGAGAQVITSRETRPRAYSRVSGRNWDVLSLGGTRPGHWMTGNHPGQLAQAVPGSAGTTADHLPPRRL
jgi:hypothetical protein